MSEARILEIYNEVKLLALEPDFDTRKTKHDILIGEGLSLARQLGRT